MVIVAGTVLQLDEHGNRPEQVRVDIEAGVLADSILDLPSDGGPLVTAALAWKQPIPFGVTQPRQDFSGRSPTSAQSRPGARRGSDRCFSPRHS